MERGRYREAVPKLEEALRTGHQEPRERFGTSRHAVDYYDPHYWLGRAFMELGDEAKALAHLRASAAGGQFPDRRETDDRARRVSELERREAARREPPPKDPAPTPSITAVPASPTAAPAPSVPTPEPLPAATGGAVTPAASPVPTPIAPAVAAAVPTPPPARLAAALASLAAGDFAETTTRVRAERRLTPEARELDLVEAAALGGQYVLEGRRETALLEAARERLAAFRKKGGSSRAEGTLLSPTLRALLEPR